MCEATVNTQNGGGPGNPEEPLIALYSACLLIFGKKKKYRLNSDFFFLTCSFLGLNIALEKSEYS